MVERLHRPQQLAGDAEGLTAGGEDAHSRALRQDPVGEPRGGVDQMLAVVEDDQLAARPDAGHQAAGQVGVGDGRPYGHAAGVAHAERGEHRLRHTLGVAYRGELGEPDTVRHPARQRLAGLHGEPGLARATRAEHRDQPVLRQQRARAPHVVAPPDEARQPGAQVAPLVPLVAHLGLLPLLGRPGLGRDGRWRVAPEHAEVQGGERGRGVGAEPGGEVRAGRLVGGERLHLAP